MFYSIFFFFVFYYLVGKPMGNVFDVEQRNIDDERREHEHFH